MENQTVCEGEISVGPWGRTEGEHWSYKAKRGITQIIITHGQRVKSLRFKDYSDDANPAQYSSEFGVSGGDHTTKIDIDFPSEFLTGITVTYGSEGIHDVVSSISFHSNLTHYKLLGTSSNFSFCLNSKGGAISGFHGVSGKWCIGSIGLYIKPACSVIHSIAMKQHTDINLRCPGLLPRSPGPWPSSSNSGSEWDDGVFTNVKCVRVYARPDISVISSVQFCYEKRDGTVFWSLLQGSVGGGNMMEVEFKGDDEFLIGIEGFHWPIDSNGMDVIRSLTFYTNKGIYGPMGYELGTYFNSMTSKPGNGNANGKLVGFFGRSCAYLNAIGVHTEYF